MPLGLFRGVRTFALADEGGSTRLTVTEEFTGPMVKPMASSMPDLQPSFDQYVAAVRTRAEARPDFAGATTPKWVISLDASERLDTGLDGTPASRSIPEQG